MYSDKNIIDYDLPDYFTVFIDPLASDDVDPLAYDVDLFLLESCSGLSLSQLISFYLSVHRDFLIIHVPWNEIDPFFDRYDCLIFGK